MGLLDSIKNRISSTVSQAKEAVSETVQKVEAKASAAVEKVESTFESKPAAPLPGTPVEQAPTTARPVSVSSPNLRAVLTASAQDADTAPPVSEASQKAGNAIYEKHTSFGGMTLDEEALAGEMTELAKDPGANAVALQVANGRIRSNNTDDVAEKFADKMSPEQLRTLAQHPAGAQMLADMKSALLSGYTSAHEKEMAAKLSTALTEAKTAPLKNTVVEMAPGEAGVPSEAVAKTATGPISAEEWADPSKLVAKLTQNPASNATEQSTMACGPSSMLASSLMGSPEKAARFVENVANDTSATTLTSADRNEMRGIASKIRNKTASYEDLNRAQLLLFRAGNNEGSMAGLESTLEERGMHYTGAIDPKTNNKVTAFNNLSAAENDEFRGLLKQDAKWTKADAMRVQELFNRSTGMSMKMEEGPGGWAPKVEGDFVNRDASGFSDSEATRLASMGQLKPSTLPPGTTISTLADRLEPGQAVSFRVAGKNDGTASNHFVTVGRRDDGQLYLYNSDPSEVDATVTVGGKGRGSDSFRALLADYDTRSVVDAHNEQKPALVPYRLD